MHEIGDIWRFGMKVINNSHRSVNTCREHDQDSNVASFTKSSLRYTRNYWLKQYWLGRWRRSKEIRIWFLSIKPGDGLMRHRLPFCTLDIVSMFFKFYVLMFVESNFLIKEFMTWRSGIPE